MSDTATQKCYDISSAELLANFVPLSFFLFLYKKKMRLDTFLGLLNGTLAV